MKKSEAPISGRFDPAARLTALLRKIRDDVDRSVNVLKEACGGVLQAALRVARREKGEACRSFTNRGGAGTCLPRW